MAVTYDKPVRVDVMLIRCGGTTDETVPVGLRVYQDGRKVRDYISESQEFSVDLNVPSGDGVFYEVLDQDDSIPSPAFPGHISLNWVAVPDASSYRVEQYVTSSWVAKETLTSFGETAFTWDTAWLADQSSNQFRVIPIGEDGNEGTPLTFDFLVVHHPEITPYTVAWDSGAHTFTLAAA